MKELPTLPPVFDEDDALVSSKTNRSKDRRPLPVDTELEIAELSYACSYDASPDRGTPFLVKDGRRQLVEPLPVAAF